MTTLMEALADGKTKSLADLAYILAKSPAAVKTMIEAGIANGTLVNSHKGKGYKISKA